MSLFNRTYTFSDGTVAYGSQVESEISNIVTVLNSLDAATTSWTSLKAVNSATTVLTADNSSGTNNIAEFKDNGTAVVTVADGGVVTVAPGGTTKAVINSSGITLSNSATIAMGSAKITGLANGTSATDAAAYGQIKYIQAPVQALKTTSFSTTSSTYQDTGLSASITPTSSSSRIKVTFSGVARTANGTNSGVAITVKRGSTDLATNSLGFSYGDVGGNTAGQSYPVNFCFIDSPATTSAVAYNVFIKNEDNATTVALANVAQCQIIAEEVA